MKKKIALAQRAVLWCFENRAAIATAVTAVAALFAADAATEAPLTSSIFIYAVNLINGVIV